ncbi:MAG: glycosyltransferase family 39 protein [Candidatus Omnitrophica bacterium]|nr:glycosyltransferase family 39 protein [Candidatus Omnitrophota bacterium]
MYNFIRKLRDVNEKYRDMKDGSRVMGQGSWKIKMGQGAWKNKVFIAVVIAVMIFGIGVRLSNLNVSTRTPDEMVYTAYASAMNELGIKNYKKVINEYNSNEKMWVYPLPVRIGYIYLCSRIMRLVGSNNVEVLALISCVSSIFSLFILVLIGLRFFNRWVTVVALALASVSPMDLAIARRAWQDGVLALFAALLIYICCEISYKPRSKGWFIVFFLLGLCCVVIKETGIVIYGLCILGVLWITLIKEKSFKKSLYYVVIPSFLGIGIGFFIVSAVCGGFLNVIEVVKHSMGSFKTNEYVLTFHSGPWYQIFQGFFILSPVTTILSFMGIIGTVFFQKVRGGIYRVAISKQPSRVGIIFFMITFVGIVMGPRHFKNFRFVSSIYPFLYLMAGVGCLFIMRVLREKLKILPSYVVGFGIILAVFTAVFFDYQNFKSIFIVKEIPDLAVKLIIDH